MKILLLSYEFPPLGGGGAKVVQGTTNEFVKHGHEVDIVTMWHWGLALKQVVDGSRVYRIPCIRLKKSMCYSVEMILYILIAIPFVLSLVFRKNYDINQTHFIFPDGIIAWIVNKCTQLNYVITAHGSDVPGYNPHRFKLLHKILFPLWRVVIRGAKEIICPSFALQSLILQNDSVVKTILIPNGINVDKFRPNMEKKARVLVVTRMLERKGVQYFLKSLEQLEHGYEIHLVGDGPYLKILKGMVNEKHLDIQFWGFLDNQSKEIRDLYETSRIFVFPSEAENFPIVLLEAMAAGMAIITTKNTGCAEVVGDAALLVNKRDSKSIYRALKQLMIDPGLCEKLGHLARKRLEENFSWHAVVRQYIDRYQKHISS